MLKFKSKGLLQLCWPLVESVESNHIYSSEELSFNPTLHSQAIVGNHYAKRNLYEKKEIPFPPTAVGLFVKREGIEPTDTQ